MDRGMASSLLTEKLDRNNYASWSYKMRKLHNIRIDTQRFPGVGTTGEQSIVLFHVLCGRTTPKLHSGCENAEGCLEKSEIIPRRLRTSATA